jgi:Fe-S-cluster containining protein
VADRDDLLDAGEFLAWRRDLRAASRGERDAEVPCGSCTACCTSSQFVHIAPDETDALAHIPSELLFPAPLMPRGNVLLGYDEHGHCPMLVDGACSIYEHRPRTCRTYDCRVFTAAGVAADKPAIAARAARWRFTYADDDGARAHEAARAVAVELRRTHPTAPATDLAARAVELSP